MFPFRFIRVIFVCSPYPGDLTVLFPLFAVLGYLTGNDDVVKAFTNINHHLKLDGLFIFDVWNGLAVLYEKPEARIRTFDF